MSGSGTHVGLELALVPLHHLALPAVVEAGLAGELAVVVHDRVQGDMGIALVVADDGRRGQDARGIAGAEGGDQIAVRLAHAPGQPALLDGVGALTGEVLLFLARDLGKRERAEGVHVEEVVRPFAGLARAPPQVRVDRMLDDVGRVAFEQRPQRGGQQRNRLRGDHAVGGEAPRRGGPGRGEGEPQRRRERDRAGGAERAWRGSREHAASAGER